jgi:hypothetical protein
MRHISNHSTDATTVHYSFIPLLDEEFDDTEITMEKPLFVDESELPIE